jgi:hypothetical protein
MQSLRINKGPMVYFHVATLYYMFMDVFIKKSSLFLLIVVSRIFFINVQLVNRLQVPKNIIQRTHVEGENIQFFLNI